MAALGTFKFKWLLSSQCQTVNDLLSVAIKPKWQINDPKIIYVIVIVMSMG